MLLSLSLLLLRSTFNEPSTSSMHCASPCQSTVNHCSSTAGAGAGHVMEGGCASWAWWEMRWGCSEAFERRTINLCANNNAEECMLTAKHRILLSQGGEEGEGEEDGAGIAAWSSNNPSFVSKFIAHKQKNKRSQNRTSKWGRTKTRNWTRTRTRREERRRL